MKKSFVILLTITSYTLSSHHFLKQIPEMITRISQDRDLENLLIAYDQTNDVAHKNNIALYIAHLYRKQHNIPHTIIWLQQAVYQGSIIAQTELGTLYAQQGNEELAFTYLTQAAQAHNVAAMINIAVLHQRKQQIVQALEWFEKAAAYDHIVALGEAGTLHAQMGNIDKAIELLEKAAHKNHIIAMANLAHLYREQGILDQAKKWHLEAAAHGHITIDLFYTLSIIPHNDIAYDTLIIYANSIIDNINNNTVHGIQFQCSYPQHRYNEAMALVTRYATKPLLSRDRSYGLLKRKQFQ